jgi:hypothetical protein
MMRALLVLWRLLFYRPLILVMLLLVYAAAALLLFAMDSSRGGLAIAGLAAFAAAALAALLTDRMTMHSLQASAIGLPDHSRVMRRVQACFLVLFAAIPAAVACALGARPLPAIAALAAAAAAGIVIRTYRAGGWLLLVPVLGRVLPLADWAALPAVQALAAVVGAYVIWRWFDLPARMERAAALAGSRLADARHERSDRFSEPKESAPDKESASSPSDESPPGPSSTDIEAGRRLARVLALALGYSVRIEWRGVLYGAGIAIAVLAASQALHTPKPAVLPYLIVTASCCLALLGRLQIVLQRWMQTATEQALLGLTPRWPEARSIKRAVLASTLLIQRGSIAVWAASSAVAVLLGWIDSKVLIAGLLGILGTSLAFSGSFWAALARRRIREWHFSTIASVLVVGAGALTIFFGSPALGPLAIGAGLMTAPPALALAWYAFAPLRIPLNVDPRALKAPL